MESNKLIAEFMGTPVKLFKEDDYTYTSFIGEKCYASFDCELAIIDNVPYETKELQYHTSWDWLMAVVEKIESFEKKDDNRVSRAWVHILGNGCIIEYDKMNKEEWIACSEEHNPMSKLDATYKCVVDFINWYNQHPTN